MGSLEATLQQRLAHRESQGRLRRLEVPRLDLVDFSSNDYLSLSRDRVVRDALAAYLGCPDQGHSPTSSSGRIIGSGGSRLLDGNSVFVEQLERKIANFHASEAALLFNSAYDANVGLISCVPGTGDVILYDNLIHASIHDGMRLSRVTRKIPFTHSSVIRHSRERNSELGEAGVGGPNGLEPTIKQLIHGDQQVRSGSSNVFICIEALYSMDGDIVDLEYVSNMINSLLPKGNGYIIIDEAHSIGVLGDSGRGLVCQLGLQDRIFARVAGFGKAMGCAGGWCTYTRWPWLGSANTTPFGNSRCHSLLFDRAPLSHQLRPNSHIHYGHVIPVTSEHRCCVRLSDKRESRTATTAAQDTNPTLSC